MGLVGGSKSLRTAITRGLPRLLLELRLSLPVGLKQLLEAGLEVVVLLLQVVQTGVDLVQHGVDGSTKADILTCLHWHAQVPTGA